LDFFNNLKALSKVQKMKEQMKSYFNAEFRDLVNFPKPVLHPLKPEILLDGIKPENCSVFKSAKVPLKLAFKRYPSDQGSVVLENVIFKSGDDLRQDQLIIQMIMLMEKIFKSEGLDLKLSPYKVLATSPRDDYLELVEQAHNVSMILKEHDNMIVNFLMKN
jgi:phosphatidylinositol 3-kinase